MEIVMHTWDLEHRYSCHAL